MQSPRPGRRTSPVTSGQPPVQYDQAAASSLLQPLDQLAKAHNESPEIATFLPSTTARGVGRDPDRGHHFRHGRDWVPVEVLNIINIRDDASSGAQTGTATATTSAAKTPDAAKLLQVGQDHGDPEGCPHPFEAATDLRSCRYQSHCRRPTSLRAAVVRSAMPVQAESGAPRSSTPSSWSPTRPSTRALTESTTPWDPPRRSMTPASSSTRTRVWRT